MNDSRFPLSWQKDFRRLVEECFRREAGAAVSIPGDQIDLVETGILDSMAGVSFLRAVETASGVSDLGSGLNERSASLREVLAAMERSECPSAKCAAARGSNHSPTPPMAKMK
jgi:hypothetical protein